MLHEEIEINEFEKKRMPHRIVDLEARHMRMHIYFMRNYIKMFGEWFFFSSRTLPYICVPKETQKYVVFVKNHAAMKPHHTHAQSWSILV